jgi:hypothetical protein
MDFLHSLATKLKYSKFPPTPAGQILLPSIVCDQILEDVKNLIDYRQATVKEYHKHKNSLKSAEAEVPLFAQR